MSEHHGEIKYRLRWATERETKCSAIQLHDLSFYTRLPRGIETWAESNHIDKKKCNNDEVGATRNLLACAFVRTRVHFSLIMSCALVFLRALWLCDSVYTQLLLERQPVFRKELKKYQGTYHREKCLWHICRSGSANRYQQDKPTRVNKDFEYTGIRYDKAE